jgi:hypothetical protein
MTQILIKWVTHKARPKLKLLLNKLTSQFMPLLKNDLPEKFEKETFNLTLI